MTLLPPDKLAPASVETLAEYQETLEGFVEQRGRIERLLERYPVYLRLGGLVYRFDESQEVVPFISKLKKEVAVCRLAGGVLVRS